MLRQLIQPTLSGHHLRSLPLIQLIFLLTTHSSNIFLRYVSTVYIFSIGSFTYINYNKDIFSIHYFTYKSPTQQLPYNACYSYSDQYIYKCILCNKIFFFFVVNSLTHFEVWISDKYSFRLYMFRNNFTPFTGRDPIKA